jgi:hypothetical protein
MSSDFIPLLTEDGNIMLTYWPLEEVYHKGLKRWFKRKPWFLKKRYLAWAIAKGLVVPPRLPDGAKSPKRRNTRRPYNIRTSHCRYREKNPNLEPDFFGNKKLGDFSFGIPIGVLRQYSNGKVVQKTNVFRTGAPAGSLSAVRTWDCKNPGPPYRSGGPFASIAMSIPSSKVWDVGTVSNLGKPGISPGNITTYTGAFFDTSQWGSDSIQNYLTSSVPSLTGYDTLAWNKLRPQVEKAGLSQFLYELRDLPRSLETSANLLWNSWRSFGGGYSRVVMHPSSVADNFLNHEFGWVPFLNDLGKLHDVYMNASKYIAETVRLNNTWQRRSAPLESSEVDNPLLFLNGPSVDPFGFNLLDLCKDVTFNGITGKGFSEIRERVKTRVWAEGSFKYYRPEFDDSLMHFGDQLSNIRRLMTIYGLRINPTVIWKLTPWSWAVDWFTHVGDFIQHHDEFVNDGLVSRYLYIMRSKERFVTKTSMANFYSGSRSTIWQRSFSQKQRKVADSPYGFDLTWNNLSLRQWGILGALGFTRTGSGFSSRGA